MFRILRIHRVGDEFAPRVNGDLGADALKAGFDSAACQDQLAGVARTYLCLSVVECVDRLAAQQVAQASLAARAGADMDQLARWISVGVERGETIQASRRVMP